MKVALLGANGQLGQDLQRDRKSTRLNSSHSQISYAVFCLKKKKVLCAWSVLTRYLSLLLGPLLGSSYSMPITTCCNLCPRSATMPSMCPYTTALLTCVTAY